MTDLGVYTPLPTVIAGTSTPPTQFPTGTVTAVSSTALTVNVRGVSIPAAYLQGTVFAVGDLVVLGRDDSSWVVLGKQAGVGGNSVLNPSFELDGTIAGVPTSWNFASLSGSPAVSVQAIGYAVDGMYELVVAAGTATQDSYVYSNPIGVVTGQQWAVSAFATASYPVGAPANATAGVYALWFANDTNLYPTTSSADTLIGQVTNLPAAPTHQSISGLVTVPAAAAFMRVALRSQSVASVALAWDLAVARRIG